MAFDRKDYGVNGSIPFIKIADRVEVDVDLKANRVSGPPLALQAIGSFAERFFHNGACCTARHSASSEIRTAIVATTRTMGSG